jgi:lipopolysaccharide transport system permease protein
MNSASPTAKEVLIEPISGVRLIAWRELFAYRDLFWLLVWRDLVTRYKQTALGSLWYIVQPLLTTGVFMLIFSRVGRIPTNGVPSSLFYLCGLLPWNYFAQTFQSSAGTLTNNASVFGKVYFPRLIVPLSAAVSNLLATAVQLGTFAAIYGFEKIGLRGDSFGLTASAWLLPLVFVQVGLFSLGVGLCLAALSAKYRDFGILTGFLVQLWMYATPVIYPLSRVPARWYFLAALNPMTYPVEALRQMLLGAGSPTLFLFLLNTSLTLLTVVVGLAAFQKVEKNFIDVI